MFARAADRRARFIEEEPQVSTTPTPKKISVAKQEATTAASPSPQTNVARTEPVQGGAANTALTSTTEEEEKKDSKPKRKDYGGGIGGQPNF